MSYGQTPVATLPTVNVTFGPTYATLINAAISELRAVVGAKVTPAGMDINSDVNMRSGGSYYGLTNANRVGLRSAAALAAATYPATLYSNTAGELYYNDAAGNQVAITLGGSVTASPGNIGGTGYGATGVEITWNAANALYSMFSGAGTYADVQMDDLLLDDGSSNFLRMTASAMAADYTLTWPAAVPATNNTVLTCSTAGALAFSATPTVTTLTTTGAGVVGSTLGVTGLITATAGLTAAANQHITLSGTGRFKHGSIQLVVPAASWRMANSANAFIVDPTDAVSFMSASGVKMMAPLVLPVGARLTSVTFRGLHGSASSNRTYSICFAATGGDTRHVLASGTDATASGYVTKTLSSLTETYVNSRQYWLEFLGVVTSTDGIVMALITYDFP